MKQTGIYILLEKSNISLDSRLLFVLVLPFFTDLYLDYSIEPSICLLGIILFFLLDLFLKKNYNSIILTLVIYIFYCLILYENTRFIIHDLRFRWFSLIFIFFVFILIKYLNKTELRYKSLNLFFIFFTVTKFLIPNINHTDSKISFINEYRNNQYTTPFNEISKKKDPVILIIFDELSSSSEVFNYTKDSLDIEFDMELAQSGFKSFPVFKSLSLATKLSLPSIFNFNLHKSENTVRIEEDNNKNLLKQSRINNELKKIFKNNILLDSLTQKDVKYNSYGVVTFQNEIKKLNYHIWDPITTNTSGTTLDRILSPTLFGFLKNKLIDDDRFQNYNKEVLSGLNLLEPENNNFYYFHFYAPHEPFKYFNEFQNNNKRSHLENHILYKRFFLSKVLTVLKKPKFDKSRIIISGDHGYRFDSIIDKNKTSLYLKGYNKINNADYFTVQDLGFLINESF